MIGWLVLIGPRRRVRLECCPDNPGHARGDATGRRVRGNHAQLHGCDGVSVLAAGSGWLVRIHEGDQANSEIG